MQQSNICNYNYCYKIINYKNSFKYKFPEWIDNINKKNFDFCNINCFQKWYQTNYIKCSNCNLILDNKEDISPIKLKIFDSYSYISEYVCNKECYKNYLTTHQCLICNKIRNQLIIVDDGVICKEYNYKKYKLSCNDIYYKKFICPYCKTIWNLNNANNNPEFLEVELTNSLHSDTKLYMCNEKCRENFIKTHMCFVCKCIKYGNNFIIINQNNTNIIICEEKNVIDKLKCKDIYFGKYICPHCNTEYDLNKDKPNFIKETIEETNIYLCNENCRENYIKNSTCIYCKCKKFKNKLIRIFDKKNKEFVLICDSENQLSDFTDITNKPTCYESYFNKYCCNICDKIHKITEVHFTRIHEEKHLNYEDIEYGDYTCYDEYYYICDNCLNKYTNKDIDLQEIRAMILDFIEYKNKIKKINFICDECNSIVSIINNTNKTNLSNIYISKMNKNICYNCYNLENFTSNQLDNISNLDAKIDNYDETISINSDDLMSLK